jgi:hypothetical protein
MKKATYLILTLLFTVGFSFPGCICNCPKIQGKYFDIVGMRLMTYKQNGNYIQTVKEGEALNLAEYFIDAHFDLNYYGLHNQVKPEINFSFINTAFACSCLNNGYMGTEEKRQELTVITLNDFDAAHLANDTINDLLKRVFVGDTTDLQTYLSKDEGIIHGGGYTLVLKKKPQLDKEVHLQVILKLDNGELYQSSSEKVVIK